MNNNLSSIIAQVGKTMIDSAETTNEDDSILAQNKLGEAIARGESWAIKYKLDKDKEQSANGKPLKVTFVRAGTCRHCGKGVGLNG